MEEGQEGVRRREGRKGEGREGCSFRTQTRRKVLQCYPLETVSVYPSEQGAAEKDKHIIILSG